MTDVSRAVFLSYAREDAAAARRIAEALGAAGLVIGRYSLVEKIGVGGCGVVWRAEQREPVRRSVALKVIKLGMDTNEVIARFEGERQALALMDHPNIARVFDGGATDAGRPFFVMELVSGIPITRYCDEHTLTPTQRIELFIPVCHAVQHAHQKGIIHRDLKPSNILVAEVAQASMPASSNHAGRMPALHPKVIDFGIAKATRDRLTEHTVHTALHQFIGTPAYMSPEQAEMSGADLDTRSDIYSLGVVLYELLTGDTPFDRRSLASSGFDQIRQRLRTIEPPRPSARFRTLDPDTRSSVARIRGTVPAQLGTLLRGDLDWIVMRCLERNRTRRYETTDALALDLQRHLRHEPVAARPPSTAYVLGRTIRQHRLAFAAAAAVTAVLTLGVIGIAWQAIRATRAEREQSRLRVSAEQSQAAEAALRQRAEAQELAARRRAYAGDMHVLQQALATSKLGFARELLDRQRPAPGQLDVRGWEWRYLWQFCRSSAESLLCRKSGVINFLSASADGQWLAAAESNSRELSVWHLPTRTEMSVPRGAGFACSAFSPRDPLLAFATTDDSHQPPRHQVRLWHLLNREFVGDITVANPCARVEFSGDGTTLVTYGAGEANEIALWRVSDRHKLIAFPAPNEAPRPSHTPFAVAPDFSVGVWPVTATSIRVIDLASGATRWTAEAAKERVLSLAFSADGRILASGAGWTESPIRLWDVASGRELGQLEGGRSFTRGLAFWPDGKQLVSVNGDQMVRVWDVAERRLLNTFRGHTDEVFALVLLPDQRTIVSGGKEGEVLFWDRMAERSKSAFATLPKAVGGWAFAPDGNSVLTVDIGGRVEQWSGGGFTDRRTLLEIGPERLATQSTRLGQQWRRYRFAPNRPLLAVSFGNGEVSVWNWERGVMEGRFSHAGGPAWPRAFFKAGQTLVVQTDGRLAEWDWARGQEVRSWDFPAEVTVDGTAFSADEGRVIFNQPNGAISVRALAGGNAAPIEAFGQPLRGEQPQWRRKPVFSPDGHFIAALGPSSGVTMWNATTLEEVARLSGFTISPDSVVFSPDSQRLAAASAGADGVKLWDLESRENVLTLEADGSLFWQIAFSADGTTIGSSNSNSGILHLWRAPSWAEIEAVEAGTR